MSTGVEGFELELGPWSVLGNKALSTTSYIPDFTAVRLTSMQLVILLISPVCLCLTLGEANEIPRADIQFAIAE